jgi:transposase
MVCCMTRQRGLTASAEEWRRRRAIALRENGWTLSAIAEALGVTAGAVSQWLKVRREKGEPGLASARNHTGRRPKLSQEQITRLLTLLEAGAEELGQVGERWDGKRVAALIKREFGVAYLPTSIPPLLRRLGWTPQKPQLLASQRDEEKIEQFKADWQAVKKGRKPRGEPSSL